MDADAHLRAQRDAHPGSADPYAESRAARALARAHQVERARADAYASTFDYGDSFLEPDDFTGAECDVDAIARAARPAAGADVQRPVHRTRRARGDGDE